MAETESVRDIARRVMRSIQVAPQSQIPEELCSRCKGERWVIVELEPVKTRSVCSCRFTQRKPNPECRECHGSGTVERLVPNRKAIACECQVSNRIADRLSVKYRNAKLTDFKVIAVEEVLHWFESGKPGLLLTGSVGTGKTHLAAAITRSLLECNFDARLLEMAEIYRRIRSCFNSDTSEDAVIADFVRTPYLTLDDFGSGALTDFERRYALEILNGRINASRRTIVTTNLSIEEIREKMDERISSRLLLFTQITLAGRDRRAVA